MGRANGSSLYNVDSTTGQAFMKLENTRSVDYEQKRDSVTTPFLYELYMLSDCLNVRSASLLKTRSLPVVCLSSTHTIFPGAALYVAFFLRGGNRYIMSYVGMARYLDQGRKLARGR